MSVLVHEFAKQKKQASFYEMTKDQLIQLANHGFTCEDSPAIQHFSKTHLKLTQLNSQQNNSLKIAVLSFENSLLLSGDVRFNIDPFGKFTTLPNSKDVTEVQIAAELMTLLEDLRVVECLANMSILEEESQSTILIESKFELQKKIIAAEHLLESMSTSNSKGECIQLDNPTFLNNNQLPGEKNSSTDPQAQAILKLHIISLKCRYYLLSAESETSGLIYQPRHQDPLAAEILIEAQEDPRTRYCLKKFYLALIRMMKICLDCHRDLCYESNENLITEKRRSNDY